MEERNLANVEKSTARITNLHNAQNLNHALTKESSASITPEKLAKVRIEIERELLPLIGTVTTELCKYQSVMEELKKVEEFGEERESIGRFSRKKYRELLQALSDKVEVIKERY